MGYWVYGWELGGLCVRGVRIRLLLTKLVLGLVFSVKLGLRYNAPGPDVGDGNFWGEGKVRGQMSHIFLWQQVLGQ